MLRYHDITKCDLKNGMGIRVVLWVSHCEHYCKGCHNPQTWSKDGGIPFDEDAKREIFEELEKDYVTGLTLSGGDPLSLINRDELLPLIAEIKEKYPDKDIWAYTGYTWEEVKDTEIVKLIDVLVDGKFVQELSTPSPKWCGSTNQRLIDVQKSLEKNVIYFYKFC